MDTAIALLILFGLVALFVACAIQVVYIVGSVRGAKLDRLVAEGMARLSELPHTVTVGSASGIPGTVAGGSPGEPPPAPEHTSAPARAPREPCSLCNRVRSAIFGR